MAKKGYLPCFSRYRHKDYPVERIYERDAHVDKVKNLLGHLVTCPDQLALKELGSYDIQTVNGNSAEGQKILAKCECADCNCVLRIDYGNNPFRVVLGLSNVGKVRNAYIFMIDTNHGTFSKRKW